MYEYEYPHPAVTADTVVFRHMQDSLEVLLIRRGKAPFKGYWALPGGFIGIDEDLPDAARRELLEETGLEVDALRQVGAFGAPDRDPRERIITVAFYTVLSDTEDPVLRAADDAADVGWFSVTALPELAVDHDEVIAEALRRLDSDVM